MVPCHFPETIPTDSNKSNYNRIFNQTSNPIYDWLYYQIWLKIMMSVPNVPTANFLQKQFQCIHSCTEALSHPWPHPYDFGHFYLFQNIHNSILVLEFFFKHFDCSWLIVSRLLYYKPLVDNILSIFTDN